MYPSNSGLDAPVPMTDQTSVDKNNKQFHLALTDDEWEKLAKLGAAVGKEHLHQIIRSLCIDFYVLNKHIQPVAKSERKHKLFHLPTQTADFYEQMADRFDIQIATFITRWVLIPAICGWKVQLTQKVHQYAAPTHMQGDTFTAPAGSYAGTPYYTVTAK